MEEPRRFRESLEAMQRPHTEREGGGSAGPSGQPARGGGGGSGGAAAATAEPASLVPPGFGAAPGGAPQQKSETQRKKEQRRRARARQAAAAAGDQGGGPTLPPPRGGRAPPPGLGAGPRPPAKGGPSLLPPAVRERRDELQAVLLKRQVAAMEVSPGMMARGDWERRQDLLAGGPDIAPPSSFEELPPSAHAYWADVLLLDHAQLSVPAQPGALDHAAAMSAALAAHEAAPPATVLLRGRAGQDFAVDAATADLLASM